MIRGYEIAAANHRGYEIAGGGGFITRVDNKYVAPPCEIEATNDGRVLTGYCCLFNKVFHHDGRFNVVLPGAFDESLARRTKPIEFWLDHDESKIVGSTDTGLELHSDERGLAFRFRFPDTRLGREAKRLAVDRDYQGMSVGCKFRHRVQIVGGEEIQMIYFADLEEISFLKAGAIENAFGILGTPDSPLAEDCRTGSLASDGAFAKLQRAGRGLVEAIKRNAAD